MHFDKNLSPGNFSKYKFSNKLKNLKENLRRYPKVDLIITKENDFGPFLICAEAKYLHYSKTRLSLEKEPIEKAIEKDLKTLSKIKEMGIAENVFFILFDDYYYINDYDKSKQIKKMLKINGTKNSIIDSGIKVLYHESVAKLKYWKK